MSDIFKINVPFSSNIISLTYEKRSAHFLVFKCFQRNGDIYNVFYFMILLPLKFILLLLTCILHPLYTRAKFNFINYFDCLLK